MTEYDKLRFSYKNLLSAKEAESRAIEGIVKGTNQDAVLLEKYFQSRENRFFYTTLAEWEESKRNQSDLYLSFKFIQVFERGDYYGTMV